MQISRNILSFISYKPSLNWFYFIQLVLSNCHLNYLNFLYKHELQIRAYKKPSHCCEGCCKICGSLKKH